MTGLTDLPVEIVVQIIEDSLLPENKYKPIIGINASWRPLSEFLEHQPAMLSRAISKGIDEEIEGGMEKWPCAIKALRL